jgi:hypothetical protein
MAGCLLRWLDASIKTDISTHVIVHVRGFVIASALLVVRWEFAVACGDP